MMRGQGVAGFGRLGSKAVPILVSLLKIFPETQHLFQGKTIWKTSEKQMEKAVSDRIHQYFRLPRTEGIPQPVTETIRALGVTHSDRAIPYLKEISEMDNKELVFNAIEALGEIDIPAIDVILDVKTPSMKLKEKKMEEVGTIVHPKVTQWLIEQLDDKEPLLRMQAAVFLAMRNDQNLSVHLMKAVNDKNKGVRAGLANVMVRLGMEAYPEIMQLLQEDKDEGIRKIITKAQIAYNADEEDDFWA